MIGAIYPLGMVYCLVAALYNVTRHEKYFPPETLFIVIGWPIVCLFILWVTISDIHQKKIFFFRE